MLLSIDCDYGFINFIYYDIGIYVVYYIFLNMFYYYLKIVMEVIKFILGEYYYKLSELIWKSFINFYMNCYFVLDIGF